MAQVALGRVLFNCSSPPRSRCLGPHTHYYDGARRQSEAHKAESAVLDPARPDARRRPLATFYMGPSTASPTFERMRQSGAPLFTAVRDPLTRFVSGWLPRTTLPLCERIHGRGGRSGRGGGGGGGGGEVRIASWLGLSKGDDRRRQNVSDLIRRGELLACPEIVRSMEAHAHNISTRAALFPFGRIGWIHWLSQVTCSWLIVLHVGYRIGWIHWLNTGSRR